MFLGRDRFSSMEFIPASLTELTWHHTDWQNEITFFFFFPSFFSHLSAEGVFPLWQGFLVIGAQSTVIQDYKWWYVYSFVLRGSTFSPSSRVTLRGFNPDRPQRQLKNYNNNHNNFTTLNHFSPLFPFLFAKRKVEDLKYNFWRDKFRNFDS